MSKKKILIIVLGCFIVLCALVAYRYLAISAQASSNGIKRVFILLGQSNMDGYGKWLEYPDEMRRKRDDIVIYRNNRWVPLVPDQRYNGPEFSFAHKMKELYPNDTIAIIKVSAGGAGIRAFIPEWDEKTADISEDAYHGPLYERLKQGIELARKDPNVVFSGVLWKQGEKDAIKNEYAKGYLDYLKDIIEAIRKDTAAPQLPVFIGTYYDIETAEALAKSHMFDDREAAVEITRAHNMAAEEIENTYVVRHGTLPVLSDGVHFNTDSLVKLGYLFANEVIRYYQNNSQAAG